MPPTKLDTVLPADFDGVFRFTNPTDRESIHKWNNIEYRFAPMTTSPMIISGATPEEVQNIRKKFARELAEREFYRSDRFKTLDGQAPAGSGVTPAIYTDEDLAPFVQKCLEPLPIQNATAKMLPRDKSENYSSNTQVLDAKDLEAGKSLKGNDSGALLS